MGVLVLQSADQRERLLDAATLILVVALSALPYVGGLGFYSDDWSLLASFEAAARSGHSVIASTLPDYGVRPVQGIYLALLYEAFGLHPLGYHLVNTAVIAACIVLLYLLLLRLRFARGEAFAAALVLALLPQLSTVRVWFAAFQIPLSLLFALVAMHALLATDRPRAIGSAVAAVVATCLSIGAYEIFAPLIAGLAVADLVIALRSDRRSAERPHRRTLAPLAVLATVAFCTALKLLTDRSSEIAGAADLYQMLRVFLTPWYDWRVGYGLNVFAALQVHFWFPLRDWTVALVQLASGKAGLLVSVLSLCAAGASWWRMRLSDKDEQTPAPWRLLVIGVAVFVLGHATFLVSGSIMFAPTGIGNRVLVAGGIGVAMIAAAVARLAVSPFQEKLRPPLFASLVALVCAAAFVRLSSIERYWAEAPRIDSRVMDAARLDLARVPAGSTVILDGVCAYHGPAIIFENQWDVAAALSMTLGRTLSGDAVSSRMTMTEGGFDTSIYDYQSHYPFGPKLFIYDPRRHLVVAMTGAPAARRYFSNPDRKRLRCPVGYVGQGVLV